jgi:hypothetical protein
MTPDEARRRLGPPDDDGAHEAPLQQLLRSPLPGFPQRSPPRPRRIPREDGRIHAILHRRHSHQVTRALCSRDDLGGVKRLPDGRRWPRHAAGGRRMPTLKSGIAWIHERHLDAVRALVDPPAPADVP